MVNRIKNRSETLFQFILFGFVGVATLVVDIGVSYITYYVVGVPAYLASGTGFLSGFFVNFPLNRKKVFNHSNRDRFSLRSQVVMYMSLSLFNLVSTSTIVDLLVVNNILYIQYAKIAVTAIMAIWNFILFKFVIFSKKDK